jgi:hypothetical protein
MLPPGIRADPTDRICTEPSGLRHQMSRKQRSALDVV